MDVSSLDATVAALYSTGSKGEREAADRILRKILQEWQSKPNMWPQVEHILMSAKNLNTKFFALQVLEGVIKYRWHTVHIMQQEEIYRYIYGVILRISNNEASFRQERLYVNKLDIILVQILKHEWPSRWQRVIPDLVAISKCSGTVCENCMTILKLLSEDVFDFSHGEMTEVKVKVLKIKLNSEFQIIRDLCLHGLSQGTKVIQATLTTLHAFLSWIELQYFFDSPLLERLLEFIQNPSYKNLALQCLTEVAGRSYDQYDNHYIKMYTSFMVKLQDILPPSTVIAAYYSDGSSNDQAFIQNLALFLTSFCKAHIQILESSKENISAIIMGLEYLINISDVYETEVFKVCLDYWYFFVFGLSLAPYKTGMLPFMKRMYQLKVDDAKGSPIIRWKQLYSDILSKLRMLMICQMAKPKEAVTIENGNFVRETMEDNDVHEIMRGTLICLTYLDPKDTEKQMLEQLKKQLPGKNWSWNDLNKVCWAIGSISGSMVKDQEFNFVIEVFLKLLNDFKICKGEANRENRGVIASNITYVIGQYPMFIRDQWKVLKLFVNSLIKDMRDPNPWLQDFSCYTFLRLVQQCKQKFVILQAGESEPFVSKILMRLSSTVGRLRPHQIHTFYESVGQMIQAESDPQKRDDYLQRLMTRPNQKWTEIIARTRGSVDFDFLQGSNVIRTVIDILQTNTSVANSLRTYFLPQISLIFSDLLNLYRMYSELISRSPYASDVKLLRSVKRETLVLIEIFLDSDEHQEQIRREFVPQVMDLILVDYARNLPDAREAVVLSLSTTIIKKYYSTMTDYIPRIFEDVVHCTSEMVTKNLEDYPDHRLKFFSLLDAISTPALIRLSSPQLKLVMDSIIWAFGQIDRKTSETGLELLLEMLKKFQTSEFCNEFYQTYFIKIEQEIFAVLTDTFHKHGFELHALVLWHLFCMVSTGALTEPLWDAATVEYPYCNNLMFIRTYTIECLHKLFPNMAEAEVGQFVDSLGQQCDLSGFKDRISDFLIQSKEFSAQGNEDL